MEACVKRGVELCGEAVSLWKPEEWSLQELCSFGRILDRRPQSLGGQTVAMAMMERLLRVRSRDGRTRPLRANPVQRAFEQRRGRHNILLKARQMGFTTWSSARFFLKTITIPGTLTVQVAHTQQSAEEIFRIVHRFADRLPEALQKGALRRARSNVRQIVFPELDSQYRVVSAADRNAGRGLTVQNLHCSELARWPGDATETLAGLRAALTPEAEMILESTPDGVGGCFYEEWQRAEEQGMVRHFFPWWMEESYQAEAVSLESLTEEERALCEQQQLSLQQIGYRRHLKANFRGLAKQEYAEDAESCFLASGESIFDLQSIDERFRRLPEAAERRWNGAMEIWLPPVVGRQYLVAVDPASGGSEGDYSAIQVIDRQKGLQCAEFAGHIGGVELARRMVEIAHEYNYALLVVERNNHGSGVLALAEQVCGYERLYRQNGQLGWLTSSVSRPEMLGRLEALLVEEAERIMSRRLLTECRNFVRLANGQSGARAGAHDDRVMAMAMALAVMAEGGGQ